MTGQEIKFAILGFGGAGRAHFRRLSLIEGVRVVKVYERKLDKVKEIAARYNKITFTDRFEDILDGSVDAVTICTPDHTHFKYAIQTVMRGLHTLVEKPMFVSSRECEEMGAVLRGSDVVFGVHHQMRYLPAFRAAHDLVQNGRLGDIVAVEADYIHDMRQRATLYDDWRVNSKHPQSIVLGGMCHTLDLMRWIVGEEAAEVVAFAGHRGWKEYPDVDTAVVMLHFPSGITGKTMMTITSSGPERHTLAVYGTQGQIHNNVFRNASGHLELITEPSIRGKASRASWLFNLLARLCTRTTSFRDYPFSINEHDKACMALLRDFADAVRGRKTFPVGFSEGRAAVELCLDGIQSYRTDTRVRRRKNVRVP